VSDFDSADISPRSARYTEELNKDLGELLGKQFQRGSKIVEREGLPPGYRMRADAHYVDQLTARSGDMPLRTLALDEIAFTPSESADELDPLVRSITAHGILQPVLVRRDGDGYRLIAGRKRLTAARAAKLSRVPCLIHQVDDAQADVLAEAEDLRIESTPEMAAIAQASPISARLITQLSEALATIGSATTMLGGRGASMAQKVALDLVRAETWRAAWQLQAATILDGTHDWQFRRCVLGATIARVCEGFAPESRLKGITLSPDVADWNLAAILDESAVVCAVTGAVIATAGLIDGAAATAISVAVTRADETRLTIDVAQDGTAPANSVDGRFFDEQWFERPGGWPAAIGAATALAVTRRHQGDAILLTREGRGSTVRLTFAR
jgi:hypothetical protein